MKKTVLAYSGELDTTFCALHLSKDLGYEVHAVLINTGGFAAEELQEVETRANSLGIASFTVLDVTKTYYEEVLKYLVFGNVLKRSDLPSFCQCRKDFTGKNPGRLCQKNRSQISSSWKYWCRQRSVSSI